MEPIKIDFSGVMADSVGPEHGITGDELNTAFAKVQDLRIDYPFLKLVNDKRTLADIATSAEKVRCRFHNLVVLGIGGSALGLRCLAGALLSPYYNLLDTKARGGFPRLFVCDNIDPDNFATLLKIIDWKETCVCVISKSGKTTETMAQFYIIRDVLLKKLSSSRWKEHVVVITDPSQGPLRALAVQEGLQNFSLPQDVGGRFSVLSSVGLFPAACVGMDIGGLIGGATEMAERCKTADIESNLAVKNACVHYVMDTVKRKPISVMMPYSDSLALFADWYAQLWAESLGKRGMGPTPVKAVGATDQHSQLQLYMEGPPDKVITILGAERFALKAPIPATQTKDFDYLSGKDLCDVLKAEQTATTQALKTMRRPVVTVTVPQVSANTMGQLFMLYQIQTVVCGKLYGMNPFDQPGVELGKKLTREMLNRNSGV
jgi:glucose-6-phosphate isomerase